MIELNIRIELSESAYLALRNIEQSLRYNYADFPFKYADDLDPDIVELRSKGLIRVGMPRGELLILTDIGRDFLRLKREQDDQEVQAKIAEGYANLDMQATS